MYIPTSENPNFEIGDQFCLTLINETISEATRNLVVREVKVTNKQTGESKELTHFYYTSWDDCDSP